MLTADHLVETLIMSGAIPPRPLYSIMASQKQLYLALKTVMTPHNIHICVEELCAQRYERGTVTYAGLTSACSSSQWCLSLRTAYQNPIRHPFPLAEK